MILKLKDGDVKIELFPDIAPNHVKRIKELAESNKYDGVVFHRVIDGFMAQTGDVKFGNSSNNDYDLRRAGTGGSELPDLKQELNILQSRVPNIKKHLSMEIVHFVKELRKIELFKQPGIAETIDWAQAIVELNYISIDPEVLESTIGTLLKNQDDIKRLKDSEAAKILTIIQTEISLINRK